VSDYFALIEFTCVCVFCEQATQFGFTKTLCPKKKKKEKKHIGQGICMKIEYNNEIAYSI